MSERGREEGRIGRIDLDNVKQDVVTQIYYLLLSIYYLEIPLLLPATPILHDSDRLQLQAAHKFFTFSKAIISERQPKYTSSSPFS